MKTIVTLVGTRPELIRLSETIRVLDKHYRHVFVHTGQNFDEGLHSQFFADLDIRTPDYQFNLKEKRVGFAFISQMLLDVAQVLDKEKPDGLLVLGDTNSCLGAYVAKQKGVPVFHMEAGNRCYSDEVPEEINRRVVDSCSDFLLPYTQRSREQLLTEGYAPGRIIVTGNPITEVLFRQLERVQHREADVLANRNVSMRSFVLATIHRNENVTHRQRLESILGALEAVAQPSCPVLLSVHPKLASQLAAFGLTLGQNVIGSSPFSFSEFLLLMKNARLVVSDSGTVPEEACALEVPCVLVRDSTERPELLETNAMVVSGTSKENIIHSCRLAVGLPVGPLPADYQDRAVSARIAKLLARCLEGKKVALG